MSSRLSIALAVAASALALTAPGHALVPTQLPKVPMKALPDLVVSAATPYGVTVTNKGASPAGRFVVKIGAGLGCNGLVILPGTYPIPPHGKVVYGLGAGESVKVSFIASVTDRVVELDTWNVVREANEGNNRAVVPGTPCRPLD